MQKQIPLRLDGSEHAVKTVPVNTLRKIQSIFCDTSEAAYGEKALGRPMVGYFVEKTEKGVRVISYRQVCVKTP